MAGGGKGGCGFVAVVEVGVEKDVGGGALGGGGGGGSVVEGGRGGGGEKFEGYGEGECEEEVG